MGGVDLADQIAGLYELDRKSLKCWKKAFKWDIAVLCKKSDGTAMSHNKTN